MFSEAPTWMQKETTGQITSWKSKIPFWCEVILQHKTLKNSTVLDVDLLRTGGPDAWNHEVLVGLDHVKLS